MKGCKIQRGRLDHFPSEDKNEVVWLEERSGGICHWARNAVPLLLFSYSRPAWPSREQNNHVWRLHRPLPAEDRAYGAEGDSALAISQASDETERVVPSKNSAMEAASSGPATGSLHYAFRQLYLKYEDTVIVELRQEWPPAASQSATIFLSLFGDDDGRRVAVATTTANVDDVAVSLLPDPSTPAQLRRLPARRLAPLLALRRLRRPLRRRARPALRQARRRRREGRAGGLWRR